MVSLLVPTIASADTAGIIAPSDPHDPQVDSGWQAGTCTTDTPTCSVATDTQFFEDAAAHPQVGFTQFIVKNTPAAMGPVPVGEVKDVFVDLPVGLSVNPGAIDRCPIATFELSAALCSASAVGTAKVSGAAPILGTPVGPLEATVYNLVPKAGQPARFGLNLAGNNVYLEANLAYESDYHESFSIALPPLASLEPLFAGLLLNNRLVFDGRSGDGTFITTPSTCLGEAFVRSGSIYSTYLLAASVNEEKQPGYVFPQSANPPFESPIPPGTEPKNCNTIPYQPKVEVQPGTAATNSPAGAGVAITVPHISGGGNQDSSVTKAATVTLPAGMGINPSAANGLQTCTDAQFGKGTRTLTGGCPPQSKIGTVTVKSPPLPEGDLTGNVYVGQQLSRDPTSGNEYRIFVEAGSARYGIVVRLVGNVSANPVTGQLSTTISSTPQVPFSSFDLAFDPGARAVLSSPPTCGPNPTATSMVPWSTEAVAPWTGSKPATPGSQFSLSTYPGGGACPKAMAARPFAPGFGAGPKSNKAGAFSPVSVHIGRPDGQQELKGAEITLPPGMTASWPGSRTAKPPNWLPRPPTPAKPRSPTRAARIKAWSAPRRSPPAPARRHW